MGAVRQVVSEDLMERPLRLSLFTEVQCPPGSSPVERLDELLEQAESADRLGFHTFWIAEIHFQPEFSLLSAPYPVLGAIAQRTRRIRLGVAVNILAVHHPVHLAEHAAMLDLLSRGRMDFMIGRGHPHTRVYEGFGFEREQSHEMMQEGLKLIWASWTQERVEFLGRFYRVPEVVVNPKPVQNPPPPIYSANSSLDGVEFAARLGLNAVLPIHTLSRDRVRSYARAYWQALQNHGHDPSERELGLLVPMHISESTSRARAEAESGIMDYYRVITKTRADYRGWLGERGVDAGKKLPPVPWEGMTFERVCQEHSVLGDPETASAAIRRLVEETRATQLLCWMNMGSVPHRLVLESMERRAREVMPALEKIVNRER